MQTNMNTSTRNSATAEQPAVRENVAQEISRLRDELWSIARDMRTKAKGASAEVQSTREALEHELERFSEQVKGAAEETRADLKQAGEDLRLRFQKLANQIAMPAS